MDWTTLFLFLATAIVFYLAGMLHMAAIASKEYKNISSDAYKRGCEAGRKAEKENVEKIIRDFAECNDDCKTNFYYGQGCNACFWNTIIKKIKGDPEC